MSQYHVPQMLRQQFKNVFVIIGHSDVLVQCEGQNLHTHIHTHTKELSQHSKRFE